MPATQRGHARRLPSGKWQLRYYDARRKPQDRRRVPVQDRGARPLPRT